MEANDFKFRRCRIQSPVASSGSVLPCAVSTGGGIVLEPAPNTIGIPLYKHMVNSVCRAFAGYWSVAATEETAMNGHWREGPGLGLFEALSAQLGEVPILAEDLGVITTDVVQLR